MQGRIGKHGLSVIALGAFTLLALGSLGSDLQRTFDEVAEEAERAEAERAAQEALIEDLRGETEGEPARSVPDSERDTPD